MSKHQWKKPAIAQAPGSGKQPRVGVYPPDELENSKPTWRFQLMDLDGPWSWARVDGVVFHRILAKMKAYESQSWKEICANRNNHCGPMPINEICPDAQRRLEEIRQADIDQVFKLNCGGAARLWGIRDRGIFRVLWWDPDHSVYPMNITDN